MRTVIYFRGGVVADFPVPDELLDSFAKHVKFEIRHDEKELEKARLVLDRVVRSEGAVPVGPNETAAACFIWSFFNTNPDSGRVIQGDVVVVDLDGRGVHIEYASPADIRIAQAE